MSIAMIAPMKLRPSRAGLRRVLVCALGAGVGLVSSPASAQERASDPDLAALVSRSALLDLGLRNAPAPEDYELAAHTLWLASDLDPANTELARSIVQAAWLSGDQRMMLDATRRVIKNDPKDTVAQLRLVSSIINEQQTVEGRLALYERFLGDAGKALDDSVRSRLALDAALLERERGDAKGFAERLHQATRLDVSNKAAAALTAQYYSSLTSDPALLLDYQVRLLKADPHDPNVHLTIARLLASQGAFLEAKRFLTLANTLFALKTGALETQYEELRLALDWQIDGPEKVTKELTGALESWRQDAQRRVEAYEEALLPTDDLVKPHEIRYELSVDKLRLLAAYSQGDAEQTRAVLDDIEFTVHGDLNALAGMARERGANQTALLREVLARLADLQLMRATVGLDAEKIRQDQQNILRDQPALADQFAVLEPMAQFAEGRYKAALIGAERFGQSPVINTMRAQCHEKLGERERAIDLYAKVARANALDAYGAFAHSRLIAMDAADRLVTTSGRQMMQIAKTIPVWIDQMVTRPTSFMSLAVSADSDAYPMGQRPGVTIRLKNIAPIPLAVGPAQPLNSRILLTPRIDRRAFPRADKLTGKVVEFDQRLRLRPLEEMSVRVDADSPALSWLMSTRMVESVRQRWRLLQGFEPRIPDRNVGASSPEEPPSIYGIVNSPLALTAETRVVQRLVSGEMSMGLADLARQLEDEDSQKRALAVGAIGARLIAASEQGAAADDAAGVEPRLSDAQQRVVVGALQQLYTRAGSAERVMMLLTLPQRHQVPAMIDFDDHVASSVLSEALIDSKVDPLVLAAALLTRTDDPEAPIFETLVQVRDPHVLRIAQIVRARLESGVAGLGTVGPGVDAMLPTKTRVGF